MKKYAEKIELVTNILTILVAITLIGFVIQKYFIVPKSDKLTPTIGKKIALDSYDFSKNEKNVFLVLMKGCGFCEASMPFYKKVIQQNQSEKIKITAILPPNTKEVENYLKSYGINEIDIRYSELSKIDIDGTPTIIVTDSNGKILEFWLGKLSFEKCVKKESSEIVELEGIVN